LSKCAVSDLYEAGCSEREVQEFVGKSAAMARHYGKAADQKKLADQALARLTGRQG
jgi:hypothetical protein